MVAELSIVQCIDFKDAVGRAVSAAHSRTPIFFFKALYIRNDVTGSRGVINCIAKFKTTVMPRGRRSARGFSLIELMIAIALLGILLALAMPSFTGTISRTRIDSAASSMSVALATARSEAIKRGRDVAVCKSADSTNCTAAGDWSSGWVVYATAGTPIKAFDAPSGGVSMAGDANLQNAVTFTSSGGTSLAGAGTITVCKTGQVSKVISVAVSGRIRVASGGAC